MDAFWLVTRDDRYRVGPGTIEAVSSRSGDGPVLIGPSLTFRKHFQVPAQLDRDRGTVLQEMFGNFLPGPVSDYRCQFVVGEATPENVDVLGLAVQEAVLDPFVDSDGSAPPVYCFERLLAERSFDGLTLLEIPFPSGRYFGVYGEAPRWSRFLRDPREEDLEGVRETIEEDYPDLKQRPGCPEWALGEDGADWGRLILELLPENPDRSLKLLGGADDSWWARYRRQAWLLLALLLVSLAVWMGVHHRTQTALRGRMDRQFEEVMGRPSQFPLDELRSEVNRLRDTGDPSRVPRQFPRLVQVDRALASQEARLLRLSLKPEGGRVIFRASSLERAEEVRDHLLGEDDVTDASITSTSSDVESGFEVNLDVQWEAADRG